MEKDTFKAHTQYGDLKGTVSADRADQHNFSDLLRELEVLKEGEVVKGITFYNEAHYFSVSAFIENEQGELRKERVAISLEDFFKTFKRFSVTLSRGGELEGQEIHFVDVPQ